MELYILVPILYQQYYIIFVIYERSNLGKTLYSDLI
jgi:hypothetical protein